MIFSLLDEAANTNGGWTQFLVPGLLIAAFAVVLIVLYITGSKKNKKREQEAQDLINAVKPGNKVKTIGGICGIVVEVDAEENTFVLETGTELSGKSYIKFDRQAIYQTDAVVEKAEEVKEEAENQPAEETEAPEEATKTEETNDDTPSMLK